MEDRSPIDAHWSSVIKHRTKGRRREGQHSAVHAANVGAEYSDAEKEWLKAIAVFQSKHRRYPTMLEAYRLALSLGYLKVAPESPLPTFGQVQAKHTKARGAGRPPRTYPPKKRLYGGRQFDKTGGTQEGV